MPKRGRKLSKLKVLGGKVREAGEAAIYSPKAEGIHFKNMSKDQMSNHMVAEARYKAKKTPIVKKLGYGTRDTADKMSAIKRLQNTVMRKKSPTKSPTLTGTPRPQMPTPDPFFPATETARAGGKNSPPPPAPKVTVNPTKKLGAAIKSVAGNVVTKARSVRGIVKPKMIKSPTTRTPVRPPSLLPRRRRP